MKYFPCPEISKALYSTSRPHSNLIKRVVMNSRLLALPIIREPEHKHARVNVIWLHSDKLILNELGLTCSNPQDSPCFHTVNYFVYASVVWVLNRLVGLHKYHFSWQ